LAAVNLACAQGLPGAEAIDTGACLHELDRWAAQAGYHTELVSGLFRRDPAAFNNSWAVFRVMDLVTVLQRDIGVRYDPDLTTRDDFFCDPRNLFVHGVVETRRGTCSSLPPVYVAVGRRLGYPLRLVRTKYHLFARWDEPGGERFNIECTSLGFNSDPDEYYLTWPAETSREEAELYGFLRTQTPREDLAGFLAMRGHCWLANDRPREAAEAYGWAARLTPRNRLHVCSLRAALDRCDAEAGQPAASPAPPPDGVRYVRPADQPSATWFGDQLRTLGVALPRPDAAPAPSRAVPGPPGGQG
jgi:hypothetical protein